MGEQQEESVGVGPWAGPWPQDERGDLPGHLDPGLLREGDRRNVVDRYRYWRHEAVVADLDTRRHGFHVAIENWGHDFNIGSVVRTANAFNAGGVHIVGRRRWNRRGAMVTDRYLHEEHHPDVAHLLAWAGERGLAVIGVDNVPGSVPLEGYALPRDCVLLLGQEGPGLSAEAVAGCEGIVAITQHGSTRSLNAGAAAAVVMYHWALRHAGGLTP
ncbi:SpoU rRNA methylase family protein [Serinicoccus hydrothermalis]|uniref:SpoU rRNA methylase family protein n=1 Tax=Serinicoccus hydrothermalis TaxID=1758689 RepID=A0A1B1NBW7_9MICO|nr:RNA methyltransferase [Serinicoccus hydrothermalis]ANS78940.1 SpoU rRNA methylase family protein [Serinicoccus hydrothermalis]